MVRTWVKRWGGGLVAWWVERCSFCYCLFAGSEVGVVGAVVGLGGKRRVRFERPKRSGRSAPPDVELERMPVGQSSAEDQKINRFFFLLLRRVDHNF